MDNQLVKTDNKQIIQKFTDKFKYDFNRCLVCPILNDCQYTQQKIKTIREQATKTSEQVYQDEISFDGSSENILKAQNKRKVFYDTFLRNNSETLLKDERCQYERKEVENLLKIFLEANYNILDPRAKIILDDLITNALQIGRMNKSFSSLGLTLQKQTTSGIILYEHPLLKARGEYSKLVLNAIDTLDKMLKSDLDKKAENDFTSHLMKQLRDKSASKAKDRVIEFVDSDVYEQ